MQVQKYLHLWRIIAQIGILNDSLATFFFDLLREISRRINGNI